MLDELDLDDYLDLEEEQIPPLNVTERITNLNKLFDFVYRVYYPSIRFHNSMDQERYLKEFYESKYAIPYSSLENLLIDCNLGIKGLIY
jgi:hypothetical protein